MAELFGYVHHSGRYDRSPASLAAAVTQLACRPDVKVIALTEVQRKGRAAALAEAMTDLGWSVVRRHELALAYDVTRFRVLAVEHPQLTHLRSWTKTGNLRAPFRALFVLLEDLATGDTYLVSVGHTPSHVQLPHGWRDNHRAREYRDGMHGWRRELRQHLRLWRPTGGVVISMDANVDVRRRWVRQYLRDVFPGMRLVRDPRTRGTHGQRAIDVVLVSRKLTPLQWWRGRRIRVLPAKDSDHRTVVTKLRSGARRLVGR